MTDMIRLILLASLLLAPGACARAEVAVTGTIQWDGNVRRYLDGPSPVFAEGNLALRPGVAAIAKDVLPGNSAHTVAHLNDNIYGNANSWIAGSDASWAGMNLGTPTTLTGFAFGRDNLAGGLTDRTLGTYTVQYTQVWPITDAAAWTTLGTVVYSGSDTGLSRRHRFTLTSPVTATGFRLWVPPGACIDELELFDGSAIPPAAPYLTAGRFGQAFQGGPAAVRWAEAPLAGASLQRPLTAEAWVKLHSKIAYNLLVAAGVKSAGHWELATQPGTGELFTYLPGCTPDFVSTGQDIADGQWHHVALVLELTRVRLYLDGTLKADQAIATGAVPAALDGGLTIGAYPLDRLGCDGVVDEVRISNTARTIAGAPAAAPEADASTIGLWHFDQASGETYADSSAQARHANLAPPTARPALKLRRGITLDRQYISLPSEPNFVTPDIKLIKRMKFDHVKLIVNPAPHRSGDHLIEASKPYLNAIIDRVTTNGLPVVICIHPEYDFKTSVLGNMAEFQSYLKFEDEFCRHIASRAGPDKLVFQLMTEPAGNTADWNQMQFQMWNVARKAMPGYLLVLGGNEFSSLYALLRVVPVNDPNVLYTFTTYEPFVFTMQGGNWETNWPYRDLKQVPYPMSAAIIDGELPRLLSDVPANLKPTVQVQLKAAGEHEWNAAQHQLRFKRLADWNQFYGGRLALWCGEYGSLSSDLGTVVPADRYRFIHDERAAMEASGIAWAYWSYNETFTVLLPSRTPVSAYPRTGWIDPEMLEALGLNVTQCRGSGYYD